VYDSIQGGSRAASRAARGYVDDTTEYDAGVKDDEFYQDPSPGLAEESSRGTAPHPPSRRAANARERPIQAPAITGLDAIEVAAEVARQQRGLESPHRRHSRP